MAPWGGSAEAYLAVPPPAQQRAVHQPGFYSNVCKGRQVSLDEVGQRLLALGVGQLLARKSKQGISCGPIARPQHWASYLPS